MFLQKQISHFLGSALRRMNLILVLAVFSTSVSAVYTYTRTLTPEHAHAATSSNLNFQARLLSANGNTVPDGYYNIEFNLYSVSTGGTSLWTETRDFAGTDDRVRTVNGYLSANLGSVTALPNIDWSQDLWLGMTVRGSAACAFATTCTPADSEMTPRTKLTAVPYALAAGNVRSANTAAASTNSDGVNITTGGASGATSNTGAITLQSGNSTTSGNTGGISLQSGNATSGNSGNITLDVGTASGTTGTISIGTSNTSGITIGKVGVLTRVDGNFTIGASAGSGTQFTNNGSTLNATLAVLNDSDGGLLGGTPGTPLTAAQSVDIYTSVTINQTTAGQDISFQNPTSGAAGRIMYVLNIGTQSFTMHSVTIPAGYGQLYIWNGSNWRLAASGGGAAITLQAGYDGGNSISSSNGRDLSFTSNDTAVDANLLMNIATGSTGEFKVQSNGTDVLQIGAAGQLQLDVQGNTGGLLIGTDANLYRSAADTLRTDDSLVVQGVLSTLRGADFSTTPSLDNFNFGVASLVRLTGASTQTITGIASGTDGRILTIVNAAAQTAYIANDSASSLAGNKIYTGTGSNLAIPAGSSITLIYDAGASYWRIVGGAATSSSGAGAPFVQGGNSFAANAVLGTNDTFPLIFRTNNADRLQLTTSGDLEFLAAATLQTNVGALTLDAATALNLGTTDATSVSISRTGQATTVNGSLNVVQNFSVNTSQFTVDASNGNTVVAGTLTVGSGATDNDTLRIIGNTTLPTPTGAGHIFYNQTNGELYIYDGTRWQTDRSTATYIVAASDSINKDKADYVADGTDDQDTINAAINALPASPRGMVYLLEGTYNIDDGADNDDEGVEVDKGGTILAGSGPSTYLKNVNGINTNFETVSSNAVSNVTIRDLQIDGNRTNQTAGSQYGIDITGLGSGAGTTAVPGVIIQNVQVKDVRTTGIRLTSTTLNSLVTGTRVVNSGTYGLEIGTSSVRNTITDSYFQGNGDVGVRIASSDNAITNNTVESNTNQGIYTLSDRTLIAGNTLRANGSGVNDSAILVNGAVGSQVTGNNVSTGYVGIEIYSADSSTVTGNTVSSTSNIGIFVHVGASRTNISVNSVYAAGSDGISINTSDYNNVSGNVVDSSVAHGIHLDSNVDYASVTGNFVYNSAGVGSSDGIFVNNSTTNNQITGNKITDTAGTGCAIDFATGTPATNTYLADNTYSGTGAASICNIPSTTIQAGQLSSSNTFVIQGTAGVTLGEDLAVNGGDITSSGALNITPGGALTLGATGQTTLLQGSITTITSTGATNDIILNSADTIELQDSTNVTGSFNVSINADIAGTLAVGTADAVTISAAGLITTADDIAINGGDLTTTAGTFNLLNAATTVNFGTTAIARTINLGTGAAAQTVNIGSTNTTSSVAINAGSGGITLSGNTSVANNSSFTVGTGSQFTNNSSTLLTAITNADTTTDTDIGTAAATVDIATTINKTQTTAGRTLTLPTPTSATAGRVVYINSVAASTQSFTMYGVVIAPSTSASFIWNGATWVATGGGSGVNTIGAVDTTPTNANGARISGSTLHLQYADATYAGLMSTTTQTFAGNKTFNGTLTVANSADINTNSTTALQVRNGATALITADTTNGRVSIGTAVPANGILTVGTNTTTAAGGLYFGTDTSLYRTSAGGLTTGGDFTALRNANSYTTLSVSNANSGASAGAWLQLLNDSGSAGGFFLNSSTNVAYGGANSINLVNAQAGAVALGTSNSVRLTIAAGGDVSLTNDLAINGGDITSSSATVNLFNGATPTTINLGTSANARAINVGTGAAAQAVTVGSTNTTSSLLLQAGSAGLSSTTSGQLALTSSQAAADAIRLNASNAAGGIDIDAGTNGVIVDTTGEISLDSTAIASNFGLTANSASNAVLTLSASNAGAGTAAITLAADETINLNAPTWQRTAAGTTTINLTDGSNTTLSVVNSGAGTASLSVDGSGTLATGLTVTAGPTSLTGLAAGSSTAASINTGAASNVGLNIQGAASQNSNLLQIQDSTGANLNRIDAGGNQENLGYINTPSGGFGQYSNLIVGSERFDTGIWARTNVSAPTANTVVGPNGTTTAESLATSASGGLIRTDSATTPTNNNYTFSVWLKSPSGTQNADIQIVGSTGGSGTVKTVTTHTTWERFWVTTNTNGFTGVIRVQIYPGTAAGTGTVHAWGAQLVLGSTPQVYAFTGNDYITATQGSVVNGNSLFISNVASTTAFQVQDVNNQNLFAVDTSGFIVNLGNTNNSASYASTINLASTTDATGTQTVNIGSGAKAANVTNIKGGSTGGLNLNVSTNSPTNINTGTSTGAVSIGNSAAGIISLQSGNATASAITINASNAAGGINIDAGTNGIIADTTGAVSLDSATASNFTVTGSGQSLTLAALGGGAQQLIMQSAGTGTNAVRIQASNTAGGIDIDAGTGGITLDTTALASNFSINANDAANAVLTISASNSGAGTAAITLAADETINLNAGTVVGTATTQNLFNATATTINFGGAATTLNIGPTGSGASSIVLSGGSADTGCTINGATGDLACSGNITGAATGTAGYFSRSGTTLQPATAGDNIQTTSGGTITSAGLLTGQAGLTVTGAAINLNVSSNFDTNINTGTSTGSVAIGNSLGGSITLQSGSAGGNQDIILNSADTIELQDNTNVTGVLTTSGNLVVGTGATSNSTIQIIGNTSFPTPTGEGHLFYRQDTDQMYIYTGSRWQADRSTATYIVAASNSTNKEKADYVATGTNDQDTINAAITALPAAGGVVYLLEGTYNLDDGADNDDQAIEIDRNDVTLAGTGPGTLLKVTGSVNSNLDAVSATGSRTNIIIRDLQIDGNKTNNTSGTQYGIHTNAVGSGTGTTALAGITIQDVIVKEFRSNGIRFFSTVNSRISGAKILNNTVYGLDISTSSNRNVLSNNTVQGSGDEGIHITDDDVVVSNNLIEGNTNYGVYTLGDRTNIVGNVFRSNSDGSIEANIMLNSGHRSTVTGNTITGGNQGINVFSSNYSTISANNIDAVTAVGIIVGGNDAVVSGNAISAAGTNGIEIDNSTDNVLVSGNRISNSGASTANDGIYVDALADNNQIVGNFITDTAGTGCAIDFATSSVATNTYLADNTYSGTGAASICNIPSTTIQAGQINSSNVFVIQGTAGVALNDGTVTSTATTFNLLNTTVTTANVLGAGTAISIGAATGTLTINNANTVMTGDAQINGGDLTSTSATVNLFNGANPTAINLGTDANAKTITVGNTTLASALNLRVGTGNFTLDGVTNSTFSVGASTTTGTITIGGTAQTGTITLGSSSGTNTVAIGDGAGATTVNIANNNTGGAVNIGAGFTTGTISIGGTGLQTGTISVGSGTGAQIINLGNGSGAKTINIGGSGANVIGIANTQTAGSVSIGAAMTSGTVNIGGTGAQTGTIDLGVGTGAQAINLGTGGTAAKTVIIGNSSVAGSTTTIQGGSTSGVLVKADGANAFRIQNTAGSVTALTADTSAIPKITIGAATGTLTNRNLEVALVDVTTTIRMGDGTNGVSYNDAATGASGKLRYYGTARNTKTIGLIPEYAGAVMTGDGSTNTGTMTSDFCSNSSPAINNGAGAGCQNASEKHNYYSWTAQATNDYDIYVRYQMPSDFSGFSSSTAIQMYGWRTSATESVDLTLYNASGNICGTANTVVSGTNTTWTQTALAGDETALANCTAITAGSYVTFVIHMSVGTNNNYARAGEISFDYYSNF